MTTLITIGLLLVAYWKFKNNFYGRLTTEYSYRFFDLRDALRCLAVEGSVDPKDWRFQYLDSSISKTVGELESINLYTIFMLYRTHKHDGAFKASIAKFNGALQQDKKLAIVHKEYMVLLTSYVISKHFILKFIIEQGLWALIGSMKVVKKTRESFKKAVSFVRIAPETSTGPQYAINV